MNTLTIHFNNSSEAREIGAALEPLADLIEKEHNLQLILRDRDATVQGPEEQAVRIAQFIENLREARNRSPLDSHAVGYAYNALTHGEEQIFEKLASIRIDVSPRKPAVFPKTLGQQIYLSAMLKNTITFGIGPAGTGKTYLAMAMAVAALLREDVSRIILTRPAIEAGENLGFLPGDFQQKVAPYLRPLYDALHDMLPAEAIETYIERGIIEVAPLAYMRGRTLNHAFVILDEAQNTTPQQMLMFLTRIGFDSRCAITGDLTQIDLPSNKTSGLKEARSILGNIQDLEVCELSERDVVRHPLVQKVIEAYQKKRKA
ncbi:PhoH family protein [Pontiella agarivorans]|uniref:PhoH-like protein n=1 Tax=Pontiella agarivorans TaxID=3038953 RepID=A0ABU5MSP1_9BACT|nr:PhoH family protein [Pontiella agarivorans]MDZ8117220.1 PhoH family protein [Pontiella agarivorans]